MINGRSFSHYWRIGSATAANNTLNVTSVGIVGQMPGNYGIRFNWAIDGELGATTTPVYTYTDNIINESIKYRMPVFITLTGGPAKNSATWKAYNNNTAWASTNRPPVGSTPQAGVTLHGAIKTFKQNFITHVESLYAAAGLDIAEYCTFMMFTEPGYGGSGGGSVVEAEGTWDDDFHVYMNSQVGIDYKGCLLMSPSFECQGAFSAGPPTFAPSEENQGASFTQELATAGNGAGTWQDDIGDNSNIWCIDIYPEINGYATKGLQVAIDEFEGKLGTVLQGLNAASWFLPYKSTAKFMIAEHGWNATTASCASYYDLARYRMACEKACKKFNNVIGLAHYTLMDTTWGLYTDAGAITQGTRIFRPATPRTSAFTLQSGEVLYLGG